MNYFYFKLLLQSYMHAVYRTIIINNHFDYNEIFVRRHLPFWFSKKSGIKNNLKKSFLIIIESDLANLE